MTHLNRLVRYSILALIVSFGASLAFADVDNSEARKDRILANLKLSYPQLAEMQVAVGEIKDSGYAGLEEGTFTFTSPRGSQSQTFLLASDDSKLYMITGEPLDVSRSTEEIESELADRAAEEAKASMERGKRLAEAVAGRPMMGNPDASVTIVEFSDFQCPYCARGANTVEEVLKKYGDDVKVAFMHFPLGFHPWAKPAAIASHCAGELKGEAFWTLHDAYFEHQKEITPENVLAKSEEYLADSGIDMAAWGVCAKNEESDAYKAASALVDADMALGGELGVSGTPGFFINGQLLSGAQPVAAFEPLIEGAKKAASDS